MIREITVLLEDDEKICVVHSNPELNEWAGPFEIRVIDDPYRDDYVEIEFKRSSDLKRVTR